MKNKKINIIILFIALFLVLYLTVKDDFIEIFKTILNINLYMFIVILIIFILSLFFKSISLNIFINDYDEKYSVKKSFSLTLIGQFLNGVTPFQSGGQPFQIYLLKKDGIRISSSANIMIKDFLAYQTALIIMGVLALILNNLIGFYSFSDYLNVLVFAGFFINVVVYIVMLLIICSKKSGIRILNKLLNHIFKFKLLRKKQNYKEKIKSSINSFYENGKNVTENKFKMCKAIFFNLVHLTLLYIIPSLVFLALGNNNVNFINSIISTAFVMLISNFIPVPGATGGIEYSFIKFFGIVVINPTLSSGMLIWRFITYIFGMMLGFVLLLFKKEVRR